VSAGLLGGTACVFLLLSLLPRPTTATGVGGLLLVLAALASAMWAAAVAATLVRRLGVVRVNLSHYAAEPGDDRRWLLRYLQRPCLDVRIPADPKTSGAWMQLRLRLPEGVDLDVALDLRRWLNEELGSHFDPEFTDATSPDEMGPSLEVVSLIIGTGLSVLNLLIAIAQWRDSRHQAPSVIVCRVDLEGATVRVESSDLRVLAEAAGELEAG
jgi:hypothetical protein